MAGDRGSAGGPGDRGFGSIADASASLPKIGVVRGCSDCGGGRRSGCGVKPSLVGTVWRIASSGFDSLVDVGPRRCVECGRNVRIG